MQINSWSREDKFWKVSWNFRRHNSLSQICMKYSGNITPRHALLLSPYLLSSPPSPIMLKKHSKCVYLFLPFYLNPHVLFETESITTFDVSIRGIIYLFTLFMRESRKVTRKFLRSLLLSPKVLWSPVRSTYKAINLLLHVLYPHTPFLPPH